MFNLKTQLNVSMAREILNWGQMLVAFAKDGSLFPSTHDGQLTTALKFRGSKTLF